MFFVRFGGCTEFCKCLGFGVYGFGFRVAVFDARFSGYWKFTYYWFYSSGSQKKHTFSVRIYRPV